MQTFAALVVMPAMLLSTGCRSARPEPTAAEDAGARSGPRQPRPPPSRDAAPKKQPAAAPMPARKLAHVVLLPLGKVPAGLVAAVASGLRRGLPVSVEQHGRIALPRSAYYPRRRRYRAERLLTFLSERFKARPRSTRVLGLTPVDISTTKGKHADWGVFGLGDLGGRACVISTFRLKRRARGARHLRFRVVSTAIHEVGHTLGLDHCTEPRCVMLDAHGSIKNTDTSTGRLGPLCRARLRSAAPR